jgi:hypothetical protein
VNGSGRSRLSTGGVAAAIGLGAWLVALDNMAPSPVRVEPPPVAEALSPPPNATPTPATGKVLPADQPAKVDRSRELELPDGTFVRALNDAVDAAPVARYWGPFPWSPIVGVERSSAGLDWYKHADGSYSTTQMVWRADLKRYDAMTRVAHPGPAPAATAPAPAKRN